MLSIHRRMSLQECVAECTQLGIIFRVDCGGTLWLAGEFYTLMNNTYLLSQIQAHSTAIRQSMSCVDCQNQSDGVCFSCWMKQPAIKPGPGRIVWQAV